MLEWQPAQSLHSKHDIMSQICSCRCQIKHICTPLWWLHLAIRAAKMSDCICAHLLQWSDEGLTPCEIAETALMCSWGVHTPELPRRRVGVWLQSWHMCLVHSLTHHYTHKHPHTLFLDVQVFKNVSTGSSGRRLAHLNGPWNGNGAVLSEWVSVSNSRVECFLPFNSGDMTPSQTFLLMFSVFRTAGWEITALRRPQMSAETLLWRTNKVLQQVTTFPVVSLPQIPCHQTPWPCHPGRDSQRKHTPRIHTPSACVTGLIIRSLAAGGWGDSNFHSRATIRVLELEARKHRGRLVTRQITTCIRGRWVQECILSFCGWFDCRKEA